jgi:hypothetical protein
MNTLNATLDQILDDQVKTGSYKTKEEVTQELLQILIERDISKSVSNGMAQIENGQGIEITLTYRDILRTRIINRLSLNNY